MKNKQLEFRLPQLSRQNRRSHSRSDRARWWFGRMRQVVDLALDPIPAEPARHRRF